MEAAAVAKTLMETLFDPVVLAATLVVTVGLLTGAVARVVEFFERTPAVRHRHS